MATAHSVRCKDVLCAAIPLDPVAAIGKSISLVRDDGECVFPTKFTWDKFEAQVEEEMP